MSEYSMGHDADEIRRLEAQGRLLAPLTRDLLSHAGVAQGMRVLDVGCGAGDVAFVAADLVGPTGEVIGFDRADTALSTAGARARAKGLTNVRFVQCDIEHAESLVADGLFDAAVSRAVLVHLAKPLDALRKMLSLVRPGGVVGFQEPEDLPGGYWATSKLTIMEQMVSVGAKLLERGAMRADPFGHIVTAFDEAGITQRRIIRTSMIYSGHDDDACALVAGLAQATYGIAQRMGLPLPGYDPKTVGEEFKKEVLSKNALFTPAQYLGAAGRLPSMRAAGK